MNASNRNREVEIELLAIVKGNNDRGFIGPDMCGTLSMASEEYAAATERLVARRELISVPYTESIGSGLVIPGHDVIFKLKGKLGDYAANARMQAQALLAKADRANLVACKLSGSSLTEAETKRLECAK